MRRRVSSSVVNLVADDSFERGLIVFSILLVVGVVLLKMGFNDKLAEVRFI